MSRTDVPATPSSSERSAGLSCSSSLASRDASVDVSSSVSSSAAARSSSLFSDRPESLQRCRVHVGVLGHPDRVDQHEPRLRFRVRRDGLEVGVRDCARPPALHLLEVGRGPHVAHEQHTLQRLHVGPGGDHVHGDRDPQRR